MQQPWNGLSPAQVVGAVAFQNRKLAIPPNTSPKLVSLMESCWAELLSRKTLHYKEGENKMWDIGSDVFDSLSLDEPDMEMVIFINEEEDMENANAMN
ncbi:hypothetical protein ERO13_A06G032648v2 [Gossypium hirsutum]|uniref:Uncharacterized protein n=1 Tax=Gossypium darwinii TaxID=34276 RepID=A0A5D2G1G8_GOSDA|nr:hypothetical protein ERO13_A06G032648v2 [Gossypium hirsutum]TYH12087.1 hypothetical protein ES288_A06G038200v1 [Gossypium darwinii]